MSQVTLCKDDIAAFRRDGAICLRGVIDSHWRDTLGQAIQRSIDQPTTHASPTIAAWCARALPGRIFTRTYRWDWKTASRSPTIPITFPSSGPRHDRSFARPGG